MDDSWSAYKYSPSLRFPFCLLDDDDDDDKSVIHHHHHHVMTGTISLAMPSIFPHWLSKLPIPDMDGSLILYILLAWSDFAWCSHALFVFLVTEALSWESTVFWWLWPECLHRRTKERHINRYHAGCRMSTLQKIIIPLVVARCSRLGLTPSRKNSPQIPAPS